MINIDFDVSPHGINAERTSVAGADFALEHFYYGQFVRGGKPEGELRLLASSAGLKQEQVLDIVRPAIVPPIPGAPMASWAVARGKTVPFIFCQAQLNEAGGAMLHFIVLPVDLLRPLSGNLELLSKLVMLRMPTYDRLGDTLPPVKFTGVVPPADDPQVDAMLTLMTVAHERLDVVESLLASIVQGVPLVVRGAPGNPTARRGFIEGLLALLPPPARFGVTFAMHATPATRVDAQIRFLSGTETPEDVSLFNWADGSLTGVTVEDDYSRFIVSQLRLDTSLVLEQTQRLTAVASWRIRRGDGLAEALRYASYRLALDDALLNNQPVDAKAASRVLAEDPTLSDHVRAAYARHVLAFALALGDMQYAEPIAIMLRQQPELERVTMGLMREALADGKIEIVYQALSSWLANPLGPQGMEWISLTQAAALAHTRTLVEAGNSAGVREFLRHLHDSAGGQIEMSTVLPDTIALAQPLMERDPELADTLFILGAQYLIQELFVRMLTHPGLLAQLPEAVGRVARYIDGSDRSTPPRGLLARAASAFGEEWEPLVLIRLADAALQSQGLDLLDAPTLTALASAAESPHAAAYGGVFLRVVAGLSADDRLPLMEESVPVTLLQILLVRRRYADLAHELVRQSRVLFSADKQPQFAQMVRKLFLETPMKVDEVPEAMRILAEGGLKPLPLAMAHFGALKRHDWPEVLQPVADRVTELLFENSNVVDAIPVAPLVELLGFHVKRRDVNNSIRVGYLLPDVAAYKGEGGADIMIQMYRALDWDRQARSTALEVLRRYIRMVDPNTVEQMLARLGDALGEDVRHALDATYAFRVVLAGSEDMASYALYIHLTMRFLRDTAVVYTEKTKPPGIRTLFGDLDSLVGGLSDEERKALSRAMLNVARAISALGKQQHDNRPRDLETHYNALAAGTAAPLSALDVLRVMGGFFARNRRIEIQHDIPASAHPLGDRAAPSLLAEARVVARTLRSLILAFPADEKVTLSAEAIRAEAESLWAELSLADRRKLVRALADDLQSIPTLLTMMYDTSDPRVLEENNGIGRQLDMTKRRPETALEFYRFVCGYFSQRAGNQSK